MLIVAAARGSVGGGAIRTHLQSCLNGRINHSVFPIGLSYLVVDVMVTQDRNSLKYNRIKKPDVVGLLEKRYCQYRLPPALPLALDACVLCVDVCTSCCDDARRLILSGSSEEQTVRLYCAQTGRLIHSAEMYPGRKHGSLYVQSLRCVVVARRVCTRGTFVHNKQNSQCGGAEIRGEVGGVFLSQVLYAKHELA